MPLGNLTSQFFANIYLNELDWFVKPKLRVKYYVRYVDDFVLLHNSKKQLAKWKVQIDKFLKEKLKLELHKGKSRTISLSQGVDFVGFRNFYYFKLLRKRSIQKMEKKLNGLCIGNVNYRELMEIFQGFNAHAKWAETYNLRKEIVKGIYKHKTI